MEGESSLNNKAAGIEIPKISPELAKELLARCDDLEQKEWYMKNLRDKIFEQYPELKPKQEEPVIQESAGTEPTVEMPEATASPEEIIVEETAPENDPSEDIETDISNMRHEKDAETAEVMKTKNEDTKRVTNKALEKMRRVAKKGMFAGMLLGMVGVSSLFEKGVRNFNNMSYTIPRGIEALRKKYGEKKEPITVASTANKWFGTSFGTTPEMIKKEEEAKKKEAETLEKAKVEASKQKFANMLPKERVENAPGANFRKQTFLDSILGTTMSPEDQKTWKKISGRSIIVFMNPESSRWDKDDVIQPENAMTHEEFANRFAFKMQSLNILQEKLKEPYKKITDEFKSQGKNLDGKKIDDFLTLAAERNLI